MSEIKVSFAAIDAAAGDVTVTATTVTSKLEDLKRFLAPMVATWDGQAATDYQAAQRRWDTAAADLNAVLTRIGVALRDAHAGYVQTETANARRWTAG